MAKKKQPYIPLYTGDYLKDTRALSLEAKGAWFDLIMFIWVNGSGGMIEGSMEDFARMVGTSEIKFASVLLELTRKNICDVYGEQTKVFKIVCRRLAKEAAISEVRSESGSKGGSKTQANNKAKTNQKSDNDIEVGNDTDNGIDLKGAGENFEPITPEVPRGTEDTPDTLIDCQRWTDDVLDGNDVLCINMIRNENIQLNGRLEELARSHLALCSRYGWHKKMDSQQAFRNSLIDHLKKELKQNVTGVTKTGNRNIDHVASLAEDHARRYGADRTGA